MIVAIAGMPRSASTFSFNIARELLGDTGSVVAISDNTLNPELAGDADHLIIKTHNPDQPLMDMIAGKTIPCLCTYRKPEDAIASWVRTFGGTFQGSLTGRDNVKLICRVYNIDFERCLAFVAEFSELGAYLREPVKSYSSGMAARLAFAISMSVEFDCFLIDEAMAVGDHRFLNKCNQELFEKRGDRAMIIVAHQMDIIREHCDHAAVLDQGELKVFDTVENAINFYKELNA